MSPISYSILFLALLLVGSMSLEASAAAGGRKAALAGGWRPIPDTKDKYVVEIGQFAVAEHNKEAKASLKFESVVKGERQVVAGMNYKLYILANDAGNSHQYVAVVYDKPWGMLRSLTSFKQVAQ